MPRTLVVGLVKPPMTNSCRSMHFDLSHSASAPICKAPTAASNHALQRHAASVLEERGRCRAGGRKSGWPLAVADQRLQHALAFL